MIFRHRRRSARPWLLRAVAAMAVVVLAAGCGTSGAPTTSATSTGATSTGGTAPSTPAASSTTATTPATNATTATTPAPAVQHLHPTPAQLTRDGQWWAVDSTDPIGPDSLANVRDWYRGAPTPLLWGRYVTGHYRVDPDELRFARAHGIGVYFIVPDSDCSMCDGGGDVCGNDRTAAQARGDAAEALRDARRLQLPAGVTLYKDIEQVGSCYGELSADYLLAWYHAVRATRFVPAFYGNTNGQHYDFPRAYCQAVRHDASFARDITLAQDEPEPQIGAPRHAIGPGNAPPFAPYRPSCAPASSVRIWQYTESVDRGNDTDADEVRPGTHGILAPDGHVT